MAQKRRPKGTGSVVKLGAREWMARYKAPDGSRPSKVFAKQADAVEWLDAEIASIRAGEYIAKSDQTLCAWIDEYIEAYRAKAAHSTAESYKGSIARLNKHAPDLMEMPLTEITEPDIQKALNQIRKKLSYRTTEITRTLLNMALSKAASLHKIKSNPVTGTKITESQTVRRPRYVEPDKVQAIEDYCLGEPFRANSKVYQDVIYFLLRTGCRCQEARGLHKSRLRKGGVLIDTVLDRKGSAKTTKNKRVRYITLPDDVLEMVQRRAHHSISGLIFETLTGTPLDHRNISRRLEEVSVGHTPHDLRHTFGTNAIRNGANPKAVADYLGDEVETVLRVYTHTSHNDLTKVHMLAAQPNKVVEFKAE